MKRIMISVFALLTLMGLAMADETPIQQEPLTAVAGEMTIEWNYPAEMNAAILGFRIYHSSKSIPWGKHDGDPPPPDTKMIQLEDPSLRAYPLVLPEGANYIRMNAIYTKNNQVVESFFSQQIKVMVKPSVGEPPPPSDLKLRNTAPTKLKVK